MMNNKDKYIKNIEDLINNPNVSFETKQLAGLNHVGLEIITQLEQINKNLEKIANSTEKVHTTGYMRTELNKGEFISRVKKELNLDTIICNQNKDSHVDKNIILD